MSNLATFFASASPLTLASLIRDLQGGREIALSQIELRRQAWSNLVALVGREEAEAMVKRLYHEPEDFAPEPAASQPIPDGLIECCFCDATMPGVEAAIEADWIPSFWDRGQEISNPVCPVCQTEHLREGPDGEPETVHPLSESSRIAQEPRS